jgi:hypothetical protein
LRDAWHELLVIFFFFFFFSFTLQIPCCSSTWLSARLNPLLVCKRKDGWVAGTHQKPTSAKFNLFENSQNSSPDS